MAERGKLLHPEYKFWTLNRVKKSNGVNWGQVNHLGSNLKGSNKGQIKISTIEITKNPTKTAIIFFPGLLILIFSGISSIKTRKINVPAATQLSEPKKYFIAFKDVSEK